MAFFGGRSGNNPLYGRDTGPPPPARTQQARGGFPLASNLQQFFPFPPGGFLGQPQPIAGMNPFAAGYYPGGAAPPIVWPPGGTAPANVPPPVLDPDLPAANMTNSTGGVGCESGYNYFFPSEHTKIHVFRTGDTPPWLLPPNFVFPFNAVHVPVNTTLGDLLKGFGACNTDASKNRVFEVHEGGGGKWYKGMCFKGDDSDAMNTVIKKIGWDATRSGLPGGKPVVYLYITKG